MQCRTPEPRGERAERLAQTEKTRQYLGCLKEEVEAAGIEPASAAAQSKPLRA